MRLSIFLACACATVLTGCATDKFVGRPDLQLVENRSLPAPGRGDLILQQRSILVGPLDRVAIDVYGTPELTRTVQVDASGRIALPLVGSVEAAGKSPAELADYITAQLRGRYVRNPQVTVSIEQGNQVVTVDGQVEKPGLYPIVGRMTLVRAVASAEGITEFANQNYVIIFRQVDGKQMAGLYDLRAIRQGMYADPEVYANDVVTVGESGGRRVFQSVIQGSALLTAPLVAILN